MSKTKDEEFAKPFRVTFEHFGEKYSAEIDHSNITGKQFAKLLVKLTRSIGFSVKRIVEDMEEYNTETQQ